MKIIKLTIISLIILALIIDIKASYEFKSRELGIWDSVKSTYNSAKDKVSGFVDNSKTTITNKIDEIKDTKDPFTAIKEFIVNEFNKLKNSLSGAWEDVEEFIDDVIDGIKLIMRELKDFYDAVTGDCTVIEYSSYKNWENRGIKIIKPVKCVIQYIEQKFNVKLLKGDTVTSTQQLPPISNRPNPTSAVTSNKNTLTNIKNSFNSAFSKIKIPTSTKLIELDPEGDYCQGRKDRDRTILETTANIILQFTSAVDMGEGWGAKLQILAAVVASGCQIASMSLEIDCAD